MENKKTDKFKLLLSTIYGLIYFILSIFMIVTVIVFSIVIGKTGSLAAVWVLLTLELVYCVTLFTFEVIRIKRKKEAEKNESSDTEVSPEK